MAMKTIRFIAAVTCACFCTAAVAASSSYDAIEADKDLQSLVTRWAQVEGKKLVWEANGNASIKDAGALNSEAALHKASSFVQALARLNRSLDAANSAKPLPLMACIFSDAIVIRTIEQAPCGSPL